MKSILKFAGILLLCATLFSCKQEQKNSNNIAVFIPGNLAGSPVYDMLTKGVQEGVLAYNATHESEKPIEVAIIEAGTNQAEWSNKLLGVILENYRLIITANPSMPDIITPFTEQFPQQKFIVLDAYFEGNNNIQTYQYNKYEQSYLTGFIAALVSTANPKEMQFSNNDKKIALIAAQEYPVMNNIILPAFTAGAQAAVKDISVDFRVVGNWYDAAKGAEIAKSLYQNGVDVILPICGGAGQGVISAAKEHNFYITWFDENGFNKAPEHVVASTEIKQNEVAKKVVTLFLEGKIDFEAPVTFSMKDGIVQFVTNDPQFYTNVSQEIRDEVFTEYQKILNGELSFSMTK